VAKALLENETIDGSLVGQLVDEAWGNPVHTTGKKATPTFHTNGSANGKAAETEVVAEQPAPAANGQPQQEAPRATTPSGWPAPEWPPPQWSPPPPSGQDT
jgi:hypothetical protein